MACHFFLAAHQQGEWLLYYNAYSLTKGSEIKISEGKDGIADDYRDFNNATLDMCIHECVIDGACYAMSWHEDSKHCWLKNHIPENEERRSHVTYGIKVIND